MRFTILTNWSAAEYSAVSMYWIRWLVHILRKRLSTNVWITTWKGYSNVVSPDSCQTASFRRRMPLKLKESEKVYLIFMANAMMLKYTSMFLDLWCNKNHLFGITFLLVFENFYQLYQVDSKKSDLLLISIFFIFQHSFRIEFSFFAKVSTLILIFKQVKPERTQQSKN